MHRVPRLLLVAPTCEYLCLMFDPLSSKPHTVGANMERLAKMELIAEQEGVQPRQLKKWDVFLGAFGSVAFAIAPHYSTFIRQDNYASCHLECFLRCIVFVETCCHWHNATFTT